MLKLIFRKTAFRVVSFSHSEGLIDHSEEFTFIFFVKQQNTQFANSQTHSFTNCQLSQNSFGNAQGQTLKRRKTGNRKCNESMQFLAGL